MASPTQWTWVLVDSGVGDGLGGLACCNSWGRKESDMTEWLNWIDNFPLYAQHPSQDGRGLEVVWHHLVWGDTSSIFYPQGAFLKTCSWEDLLDLENEKYVVSLSLIWAGLSSSLPLALLLSLSVHQRQSPAIYPVPVVISIWKCKQEAGYKCLTRSPSISCLST